jgi:predicted short-subunit dehydrogenase-like oxidoreductase (DUF2520 family)
VKVSVIGAGRVGTAMAVLLMRAGHKVVAVSGRGPTRARVASFLSGVMVLDPAEAAREGELVLIGMPDDLIAATVKEIATAGGFGAGTFVAHLSGAAGLDALDPAREAGARRLAIHPLQTFPDVAHAVELIPGCTFAVTADDDEGYQVAERVADDVLGEPFRLADALRPLYHAAAVFASNYLVVTSGIAAALFEEAGVPDPVRAMVRLQSATLDNVRDLGPEQALTGPVVRGDGGTVERNLAALSAHAPEAVPIYVAMARAALDLASRSGRLDAAGRAGIEEALARWS